MATGAVSEGLRGDVQIGAEQVAQPPADGTSHARPLPQHRRRRSGSPSGRRPRCPRRDRWRSRSRTAIRRCRQRGGRAPGSSRSASGGQQGGTQQHHESPAKSGEHATRKTRTPAAGRRPSICPGGDYERAAFAGSIAPARRATAWSAAVRAACAAGNQAASTVPLRPSRAPWPATRRSAVRASVGTSVASLGRWRRPAWSGPGPSADAQHAAEQRADDAQRDGPGEDQAMDLGVSDAECNAGVPAGRGAARSTGSTH